MYFVVFKPRWVTFVALAATTLALTIAAVGIGIFIGYTYCYLEHRSGFKQGNFTQSTNLQILHLPFMDSSRIKNNKTINGALMSSVIVSRILNIGHALLEDELSHFS
ncbi:uncharacterized protein LOC131846825 isoform X2 [Achroia grisella]|uniref:uncharacterized protein LOC131846825 isoform X2 n=1 Tax=Achroia grisella TaxID=688607 RepID=UPI0027D327B3|nr:uncharacterized protein LOC131846825 isoform X2 [Achroia grisella]